MGSRSPTMVKAHVSPGLRVKTKPQIEQRSSWDHPENSDPSPQCGQRLSNPPPSVVLIDFEREGVIHPAPTRPADYVWGIAASAAETTTFTSLGRRAADNALSKDEGDGRYAQE